MSCRASSRGSSPPIRAARCCSWPAASAAAPIRTALAWRPSPTSMRCWGPIPTPSPTSPGPGPGLRPRRRQRTRRAGGGRPGRPRLRDRPAGLELGGLSPEDAAAIGLDPARGRFPTQQELEAQRDAALLHGRPRLILWFGYVDIFGWDPAVPASVWTHPADSEQRWGALVRAAFAPEPTGRRIAISGRPVRVSSRGMARVRVQVKARDRRSVSGSLELHTAPAPRSANASSRRPGGRAQRVGRRSFRVRPGRSTFVPVALSVRRQRLLRRHGKSRVRATARMRDRTSRGATAMLTLRGR